MDQGVGTRYATFLLSTNEAETIMRALITGAAGFIGSNLADRLLADGHDVVGVDCFTDYYDSAIKRSNLDAALAHGRFAFVEEDLLTCDLDSLLDGVDVVFHHAGQPGVRLSWADGFETYLSLNVLVTQRLLEATTRLPIKRFIFASSSSLYGAADRYPTGEASVPRPMSPYGVTKLAAEHLCSLYHQNYGVPTVSLRYFTVYGPRQRPDMATHRLIDSALNGSEFVMFGDGSQIRDFTYVGDVVQANVCAATESAAVGRVFNIGGGSAASMHDVVAAVTAAAGQPPHIRLGEAALGDVRQTGADITAAKEVLSWEPMVDLQTGIAHQVDAARN
jgi:UDP-glucuronate 4-epimerase